MHMKMCEVTPRVLQPREADNPTYRLASPCDPHVILPFKYQFSTAS
jgi:hypothetical protein